MYRILGLQCRELFFAHRRCPGRWLMIAYRQIQCSSRLILCSRRIERILPVVVIEPGQALEIFADLSHVQLVHILHIDLQIERFVFPLKEGFAMTASTRRKALGQNFGLYGAAHLGIYQVLSERRSFESY
jgi:hypothetical protein